ncbi:MAG: STAS domain-containing protein [Gammaproteobacteria bacterium]|nr:STAS domain-containing protein [Gammaproteobacteria bacterium]MCW8986815.1 STAS domain-containing protein [Gammaproteobacteria bacterium]
MAISGDVSADGSAVTINISGRFDFNAHHDFRNIYRNEASNAAYTIDMSGTEYIDSSALGMLLLLREHAGNESANITINGCNDDIKKIFAISNFEKLFKIT